MPYIAATGAATATALTLNQVVAKVIISSTHSSAAKCTCTLSSHLEISREHSGCSIVSRNLRKYFQILRYPSFFVTGQYNEYNIHLCQEWIRAHIYYTSTSYDITMTSYTHTHKINSL